MATAARPAAAAAAVSEMSSLTAWQAAAASVLACSGRLRLVAKHSGQPAASQLQYGGVVTTSSRTVREPLSDEQPLSSARTRGPPYAERQAASVPGQTHCSGHPVSHHGGVGVGTIWVLQFVPPHAPAVPLSCFSALRNPHHRMAALPAPGDRPPGLCSSLDDGVSVPRPWWGGGPGRFAPCAPPLSWEADACELGVSLLAVHRVRGRVGRGAMCRNERGRRLYCSTAAALTARRPRAARAPSAPAATTWPGRRRRGGCARGASPPPGAPGQSHRRRRACRSRSRVWPRGRGGRARRRCRRSRRSKCWQTRPQMHSCATPTRPRRSRCAACTTATRRRRRGRPTTSGPGEPTGSGRKPAGRRASSLPPPSHLVPHTRQAVHAPPAGGGDSADGRGAAAAVLPEGV